MRWRALLCSIVAALALTACQRGAATSPVKPETKTDFDPYYKIFREQCIRCHAMNREGALS
jgi:hypothetical protein